MMSSNARKYITPLKTAVFKLHNPSCRKRAMLEYALRHNHLAYSRALAAVTPLTQSFLDSERTSREADRALPLTEQRKKAHQRKFERERILVAQISKTIKPLPTSGSSKALRSIPGSLVGQIESYIELDGHMQSVGFPSAQRLQRDQRSYEQKLQRFASATLLEEENIARDELLSEQKVGKYRPLLFATNRKSDGFLLLVDPETRRYYAFLNLVSECSRFAKFTEVEQSAKSCRKIDGLVDLHTGEVVRFSSKTGCLFPLEFGRDYQLDEYLKKGKSLSAKLHKIADRYELHVAFEFEPQQIEPHTFLGVDRGIYNLASLAVVDENGRVADRKNVDGRGLRFVQWQLERRQRNMQQLGKRYISGARRHFADEAVHTAANEIVDMAAHHQAQVIIENLGPMTSRSGKRKRSNFNRVLNRSQYQKLENVLTYKLAVVGLPVPISVHPGYTSQTCPCCGHCDSANREKRPDGDGFKLDIFKCADCGFTDDADLNAARVIALKRIWRESLSPALRAKKMEEIPVGKSFKEFLRNRAERRGERSCAREGGSSGSAGLDGRYEDGEVPPSAAYDGGAVEPRSGSNTPAGKNTPTKQLAVSPLDENPRLPMMKREGLPDE